MHQVYTLIQKAFLPATNHWRFWILTALVCKVLILLFQISQHKPNEIPGFIGNTSQDTESYLLPVENLFYHGSYTPDYRMPGYAAVYFPLLVFFSKAWAGNIIVFLQVILAAISVYCLALIAKKCFRSDFMFYLVFYLYVISTYTSVFDNYLLSESFCTSAAIFSVYFLTVYIEGGKRIALICSGLFLTWVVFLRPMYAPLFLVYLLVILFHEWKTGNRSIRALRSGVIFLIPFLLIESAWVIRNYNVHKRIVVLTSTLYSPEFESSYVLELMNFVKTWGGDRTWWNPDSEMRWFGVTHKTTSGDAGDESPEITIPTEIYTSRFNRDSLEAVRSYIFKINDEETGLEQRARYTDLVKKKLVAYTESIKEEKPFLCYIKAPARLFVRFFMHSGTYNLFNKSFKDLNLVEKGIKIFYSLLYLTALLTGFPALIMAIIKNRSDPSVMLVAVVLLYSIILFPLALRQIEFRYFAPAYPFLLLMACYGVWHFSKQR